MRWAKVLLWLSSLVLAMSFLALAASLKVEWSAIVALPFMVIVHTGTLVVCMLAMNAWWKLRSTSWSAALRAFPRWLIALGVVVVILAAAVLHSYATSFDQHTTDTGAAVTERQWFEKEGRYFLRLNAGPLQEITRAEYQELTRQAFQFFAALWIVFSYISVCLSQSVWQVKSEQAVRGG